MNLLPFTVYERLGLVDLKPIKMVLQLVNYSTRLPKGMVEDVLIKLRCVFWVDVLLLEIDMVVSPKIIILSRPYVATSNAPINYKDLKIKLTFENMVMELNVFNL